MTGVELSKLTDQLNLAIVDAETAIAGLHIGVRAQVEIERGVSLVFGKESGKWRLMLWHPACEPQLLVNASREMRVKAVKMLPALVEEMRAVAENQHSSVEFAIGQVEAFIAFLKKGDS